MGVELGRLVQQRRHELNLSRRDLAEQSDVSYPYVSQIETGERDPSLRTMHKLAEVLDVPVEQMAALVAPEDWIASGTPPMAAVRRSQASSSRPPELSFDAQVDLYRDKVLPALERRLQGVPPLVRVELLAELTRQAVREQVET